MYVTHIFDLFPSCWEFEAENQEIDIKQWYLQSHFPKPAETFDEQFLDGL